MPISKASSSAVAPGAKGDLVVGSATNDAAVLGVGSNDQVLTADSSTATGLKWAAAGGALTISQIATGNINSGTSVTISSLSSYDTLILRLANLTFGTTSSEMTVSVNSAATNHNYVFGANIASGSNNYKQTNGPYLTLTSGRAQLNTSDNNLYYIVFTNCKSAGFTNFQYTGGWVESGSNGTNGFGTGIYTEAAAVSNLKIATEDGYTFNGTGTYTIWGA